LNRVNRFTNIDKVIVDKGVSYRKRLEFGNNIVEEKGKKSFYGLFVGVFYRFSKN